MSDSLELINLRKRVSQLESFMQQVCSKLEMSWPENYLEVDNGIVEALRSKNMIEAVRIYDQIHKCGLAQAKTEIERIKKELNL